MDTISFKIPTSWKELVKNLAESNSLEMSDVARKIFQKGIESEDLKGELSLLKKEGEMIVKSKRTLEARRAMAHFGGHQSGWRGSAERIENPDVQMAYLRMSEETARSATEYAKEMVQTLDKKKSPSVVARMWAKGECGSGNKACMNFIKQDEELCMSMCKRAQEKQRTLDEARRKMKELGQRGDKRCQE